jgi:restriction system protein
MGRSRGFVSTMIRMQRAARRAQKAQAQAAVRSQRDAERSRRVDERRGVTASKEQRLAYAQSRLAQAGDQVRELEQTVSALESVLRDALGRSSFLDVDTLKEPLADEPFQPGNLAKRLPAPALGTYLPPPPGWHTRLVPGAKARHERETDEARKRFEADKAAHVEAEKQRQAKLEEARAAHEARVAENRRRVEAQHAEVEELKRGFQAHAADAVAAYFTLVLDRSDYPDGFAGSPELTYEPEAKKLVVDMELPGYDVVPEVGSFRYAKSKDEIVESPRPAKERRSLYSSVIAQTALRSLHEIFSADMASHAVDTVLFNGSVNGIDPGTGQPAKPCIVTVQASPDVFTRFDLHRVEPAACVRALHGAISKSPEELIPVELVREFNVIDPGFRKKVKT